MTPTLYKKWFNKKQTNKQRNKQTNKTKQNDLAKAQNFM